MMGVRAGNHTVQVWNSVLPVPVVSLWGLINQESDGTLVTVVHVCILCILHTVLYICNIRILRGYCTHTTV